MKFNKLASFALIGLLAFFAVAPSDLVNNEANEEVLGLSSASRSLLEEEQIEVEEIILSFKLYDDNSETVSVVEDDENGARRVSEASQRRISFK